MPIVLDYAPDGAIIAGTFYSHFLPGAIETGAWQAVMPGAVYARAAHVVGSPGPVPGFLAAFAGGGMGFVDDAWQGQGQGDGDAVYEQQGVMEGLQGAAQEAPNVLQSPFESGSRSRSPSPPPTRSQKRRRLSTARSLEVTLPIAVNVEENSGVASIANTAAPKTKTGKATLPRASQIPHIGTTFKDRRALLLRHDDPYICNLCSVGFPHPNDVKGHFNGHPDQLGRGCWMKNGAKAGVAWNAHESCKVSEGDLRVERVREGWVLGDQASWDRINAAAEAGRAFKAEQEAAGLDGSTETVTKAKAKAKGKGKGKEVKEAADVVKKVMQDEKEMMQVEKEAASVEKRKLPKKKVVRAGDETETDVSGGGRMRK